MVIQPSLAAAVQEQPVPLVTVKLPPAASEEKEALDAESE
jgi:hypothetical protein